VAFNVYLHRAASSNTGILPATNVSISATAPTWTPGQTNSIANTPLLTNFSMDDTISAVAQTSLAYLTDNVATNQKQPLLRFLSDPIAAQTIQAVTFGVSLATSQSNANSNFEVIPGVLGVWRPTTGALVGYLYDFGAAGGTATGTIETTQSSQATASSVTSQDGDILVLELWRNATVQSMATSYTNTIFYDGTTEASATDNAATLSAGTTTITMYVASTQDTPELYGRPYGLRGQRQMHQLLAI
jgi:hypothetical protein